MPPRAWLWNIQAAPGDGSRLNFSGSILLRQNRLRIVYQDPEVRGSLPDGISRPGRGPGQHRCLSGEGLQPETPALCARLSAAGRVRAWAAGSKQQAGRCAARLLMSFLRHEETYPFDEGVIAQDHALAHRTDEFPAGDSLAGCTPAEPASASPADRHLAGERPGSTI
jgi:hypothetical protein